MIKVVYANSKTGTIVHDIYLSCSDNELNSILVALSSSSSKKQKEVLSCFYNSFVRIWEEVKLEDIDFFADIALDENYKAAKAIK